MEFHILATILFEKVLCFLDHFFSLLYGFLFGGIWETSANRRNILQEVEERQLNGQFF